MSTHADASISLSPHGRLLVSLEGLSVDASLAASLSHALAQGSGHFLLALGGRCVGVSLPPEWAFWQQFAGQYLSTVCMLSSESGTPVDVPPPATLDDLVLGAPVMRGGEYLTSATLRALWSEIHTAFVRDSSISASGTAAFLKTLHPSWNVVGRVHFNLAENRRDPAFPFAFLATFTPRLSAQGTVQHVPLEQAMRLFANARNELLALLVPVQTALVSLPWLSAMVDAGEIFHPLRWTANEAYRFLQDTPVLERAGIIVRMPANWKSGKALRPVVTATMGSRAPSGLGTDALLDFDARLTLDGETLTANEVRELLSKANGFALLRGRWVEIDSAQLSQTLSTFDRARALAASGEFTFAQAMRMLAGLRDAGAGDASDDTAAWSDITAGPWLKEKLEALRNPAKIAAVDPGKLLHGVLRPYQQAGVRWLHLLAQLGLGACLADDMGLGKTIQVLALLLVLSKEKKSSPSLLVVPASLLGNWASEAARFAPGLRVLVLHPSSLPVTQIQEVTETALQATDLVITSYGTLTRIPWMISTPWRLAILDEAQAIKNPGTQQSRSVKKLKAQARIALTGTPVENRLSDLWSIFDFINPGLLGTAKEFTTFTQRRNAAPAQVYRPLRALVQPYILRRLKTDKTVINDLPSKTELTAFCSLRKPQAVLYQHAVKEFEREIDTSTGMQRRGSILALLLRLKQICNHPSQSLGDNEWKETDSGKWERLRELCEVIAARQEKTLLFTQFREITAPLQSFLAQIFGRTGLVLHGDVPVKQRKVLVDQFQNDESIPFFVLSLKAGGSGLNLTAASHVIHFDRWWNPAVENQATDRAFRIGQTLPVMVHKFVCRGTVEEKIDAMIQSKKQLSNDLLEGTQELNLTELDNRELLRLVSLDLHKAMEGAI